MPLWRLPRRRKELRRLFLFSCAESLESLEESLGQLKDLHLKIKSFIKNKQARGHATERLKKRLTGNENQTGIQVRWQCLSVIRNMSLRNHLNLKEIIFGHDQQASKNVSTFLLLLIRLKFFCVDSFSNSHTHTHRDFLLVSFSSLVYYTIFLFHCTTSPFDIFYIINL